MQAWINLISQIPKSDWTALGAFLAAGGGVSVVLQVIKHFKSIDSAAISRALLATFSFMTAAVNYILYTPGSSLSVLASHTAIVMTAAHVWYWFTVGPAYKWLVTLLNDAENYRSMTAPQPTSVAEQPPEQFAE